MSSPPLIYVIKQVELLVRSRLDELVRSAGITTHQFTALTVLAREDALTAAALARRSFVTAQATADMVNALEGRHLISRRRDPRDRRCFILELTDHGIEVLNELAGPTEALEREMLAGFSDTQLDGLRDVLYRCRENLGPGPPTSDRSLRGLCDVEGIAARSTAEHRDPADADDMTELSR